MAQLLDADETAVLQVLAFFFLKSGNPAAAERAAKALLAVASDNDWARQFLVLCADAREDFAKVVSLTGSLDEIKTDAGRLRALLLLRARALHKLGRSAEVELILKKAQIDPE